MLQWLVSMNEGISLQFHHCLPADTIDLDVIRRSEGRRLLEGMARKGAHQPQRGRNTAYETAFRMELFDESLLESSSPALYIWGEPGAWELKLWSDPPIVSIGTAF